LTALPGDFFAAVNAEAIGPDTILERAAGAVCRVERLADGRVSLRYTGGSLEGPPKIASALRFIARTHRFTVRFLPDDLSADGKVVLVRRLVRDKFLRRAAVAPVSGGPSGPAV